MSRSADYTIKGFLYQFNKTLLEILNSSDDSIITVEGIIEDVEIETPSTKKAIQCKYHETNSSFTLSYIFKPLLQMMHHFHLNDDTKINYILFAHYPTVIKPWPTITKADCEMALNSKNKSFKKLIDDLKEIDIDKFLSKFSLEFGCSYDELVKQTNDSLESNGFAKSEIVTLAYPNSINEIAQISIRHKPSERKITKHELIEKIKSIRKTAISHWTLALNTKKQLLDARKKQLKIHLDKNTRDRYFIIDENSIDDFEEEIVIFINDYIEKYHFKPAHINTPVFCLRTPKENFQKIQRRLYSKGILSTDGYVGGQFQESLFFRNPICKGTGNAFQREFSLRFLCWEEYHDILNNKKCDDLFIFGKCNYETLDTIDINVEVLNAASLKEIKYIMGVSNVYE